MLVNLKGLGACLEYDANSVCMVFDPTTTVETLTPTPKPQTIKESIVPVSTCPWYSKPEIGAASLVCTFPSNAALLLGAAGVGVLIFLSVRS
jgi:hypothetical protein